MPFLCLSNETGALSGVKKPFDMAESGVSESISSSQTPSGSAHGDGIEHAESDSFRNANSESNNEVGGVLVPEHVSPLFAGNEDRCGPDSLVSGSDFLLVWLWTMKGLPRDEVYRIVDFSCLLLSAILWLLNPMFPCIACLPTCSGSY